LYLLIFSSILLLVVAILPDLKISDTEDENE
jgi:hypothetical protein